MTIKDLLCEHFFGPNTGCLDLAIEYVRWHRAKFGEADIDTLIEDGMGDGHMPAAISAALLCGTPEGNALLHGTTATPAPNFATAPRPRVNTTARHEKHSEVV
jgi:hypothetical protein